MEQLTTVTLTTPPRKCLRALKNAAAEQHPNWYIRSGGDDDQPRFVIEKKVNHQLVRGMPTSTVFKIMGSFDDAGNGQTRLQYGVSGQPAMPFIQAVVFSSVLLIMALFLVMSFSSPQFSGNLIGWLLVGVLVVSAGLYAWFSYRSYQGHLKELRQFMEKFAG